MVSKSKSTLKASKIEKYIKKKYNPTEYKVNFFDRNESINIQIETVSKKKGFKVVTPIILEEEDIIKIAQKILKKKDITASEFKISISHVDGQYQEPLDYGSYEFAGVSFVWDEE